MYITTANWTGYWLHINIKGAWKYRIKWVRGKVDNKTIVKFMYVAEISNTIQNGTYTLFLVIIYYKNLRLATYFDSKSPKYLDRPDINPLREVKNRKKK